MNTKTIAFLFISISLCSCSSINKYNTVEYYLKSEVIDQKNEYLLIKEKVATISTLRILFGSDSLNEFYNKNNPIDIYRSEFLKEPDWKNIYNKYKNDTISRLWSLKDFPNLKIELQNKKELNSTKFLDKYETKTKRIIWISEPIYYQRKKLLLFYFSESDTYQSVRKDPRIVIMKKIKDKWEVVGNVYDYILY